MFDLWQHRQNTDIACGTYPIIDYCDKENNNFSNLKEMLLEYFKDKNIPSEVEVEVKKVTKKYTYTSIVLKFNEDEWGYMHKRLI